MKACRQTWKVEAARDGRLSSPEAAAVTEHALACAHCALEASRLAKVNEHLQHLTVPDPSPFTVRKARRLLLEAATAEALADGSRSFERRLRRGAPSRVWFAAAVAALLVLVGARFLPSKAHRVEAAALPAASAMGEAVALGEVLAIEVRASADSRWTRRSDPSADRITLEDGVLWVKVPHDAPHSRLVFRVPDGEIADIGTTFTVTVQNGRTKKVSVDEGVVEVRVHGLAEVTVEAGHSWERHDDGVVAAGPSAAELVASDAVVSVAEQPAKMAGSRHRLRAPASTERSRFSHGAGKLANGRAEDAAYLQVLVLERTGRLVEARAQARKYLSRFPAGFRRTEMEDLAAATTAE